MSSAFESEKLIRGHEKLRRELGSDLCALLDRAESLEDIVLNDDGRLWVKFQGEEFKPQGTMRAAEALSAMFTIADIRGTVVNYEKPILETEMPIWGCRFEGLVPPVVSRPVFAIRQRPKSVFSLQHYVDRGIMTEIQKYFVEQLVRERKSILVAGGTGSGKTTLMNAIVHAMADLTPEDRLVIIEDTAELQVASQNRISLLASGGVTMLDCLKATMRLIPTRIVVGEVRGREALSLVKAWNTGHPGGVASVHANSAYGGLVRMESLVAEETPNTPQQQLIAEAVNAVVFMRRERTGGDAGPVVRRVKAVQAVTGYANGRYLLEDVQ